MSNAVQSRPPDLSSEQAKVRRKRLLKKVPLWLGVVVLALVAAWILVFANGTPVQAAISDFGGFFVTILNGLTFAGLLFVVASGFTLIFGLMRTVNMAHGSLFLLAAFIAIGIQQAMVGQTRNIEPEMVSIWAWIVPLLAASAIVAVVGLVMYEVFLRWNAGQELRQALITIAISVILADQMLRQFGGLALTMTWPGAVNSFFTIFGARYATSRLFMLGVAIVVGVLLWQWLNRTRMGMVIRAGVDDEQMVRALGINIALVFAVTFFVGCFLAGLGGVMAASFAGVATGSDGNWLLNSLVVVIIGGMGSIKGAVAGSVLFGMVSSFAPAYLPTEYAFYAIIFTFVLLALVLAIRPYGLYGRAA